MSDTTTQARNASLADLANLLTEQHARKVDIVAPARNLRTEGGLLVVEGAGPILGPDGVTSADGTYRPTDVFDDGLSAKLQIPRAYLRRLRDTRPDLLDANVNGWLHGRPVQNANTDETFTTHADGDPRSFLVRAFRSDESGEGVARAFLSDSYRIVDNLDVLTAALSGVQTAGVPVDVVAADLSDRRMYVKVTSPAVAELAPELLAGYRSPFTGQSGSDNPNVFAGFVISNSETGNGRFTITPQIVVQICGNGMTITRDALAKTHLGQKLEHGVIQWSPETLQRNLDLVTAQARDAVATFLDIDYLRAKIGQLSEGAGKPVDFDGLQTISNDLQFTEDERNSVLDFFVSGGQPTVGGVAQAISAASKSVPDPDRAYELEAQAGELLLAA